MYYRTYAQPDYTQITLEDLYSNNIPQQRNSQTYHVQTIPDVWYNSAAPVSAALQHIFSTEDDTPMLYSEYKIPKTSGGFRDICAPNEELKSVQRDILKAIMRAGNQVHDCAYAYVPNRTCKDALIRHQQNNSKWFYKYDLSNFFPSCTEQVVRAMFDRTYPFCCLSSEIKDTLIRFSIYNGALPQGSPLSPLFSNLIMLPFDYAMEFSVAHNGGVYTRYADDILISYPKKLSERLITKHILEHLDPAFKLNVAKTRVGSINGKNFNLGLMLNKDNQITLGHERKLKLKAKLNNFLYDWTIGKPWCIIDTQVFIGELNYFKQIEPEYAAFVIHRLEQKYHADLSQIVHQILHTPAR